MKYFDFFIYCNLYLLLPLVIAGLVYFYLNSKTEDNMMKKGWELFAIFGCIGTPIHELSHYLMCLLFQLPVKDVKFFRPIKGKKDGLLGYVHYSYNPNNIIHKIGNFFVGIAPMVFGSIVILFLFITLLPDLYINLKNLSTFELKTIFNTVLNSSYDILSVIIFLFVSISIAMQMSISDDDLDNALLGIVWLEGIIFVSSIIFSELGVNLIPGVQSLSILLIFCLGIGFVANCIAYITSSLIAN